MRRRALVIATVIVVLAAGAVVARCHFRRDEFEADVHAIHALDADSALIVWFKRGSPARGFVGRVRSNGDVMWRRELPGRGMAPYENSVVVSHGIAFVRHELPRENTDQLAAIAIDDGRQLWTRKLGFDEGEKPSSFPVVRQRGHAAGEHAIQYLGSGPNTILALEPRTGRELWRAGGRLARAPIVIGGRLITHDVPGITFWDVATGTRLYKRGFGSGCAVGTDYLGLVDERDIDSSVTDGYKPVLVAFLNGNPETPHVISRSFPGPTADRFDRVSRIHSCGRYRDRLVIVAETSIRRDMSTPRSRLDLTPATVLFIANQQGEMLQAIELQWPWRIDSVANAQELPRFIAAWPPERDHGADSLVMIDLESGRVVSRGPAAPSDRQLFQAENRWYLFADAALSVFDAMTGRMLAAVEIANGDVVPNPTLEKANRIWIAGEPEGSWAVLDATTLKPLHEHRMHVTDVTEKMRAQIKPN